ncbi:ROK family protein [Actinophytocola oryzae]|uniref:ROK family protein n=1 Tax=Actinophytocola oryzae TaxID=502181 RepID=UPI001AAFC6DF|nr:ROK family protein [Actinophytocola oryzae]
MVEGPGVNYLGDAGAGAGALLRLMRDGQPRTRAELAALTGLARSTIAQRIDALLAADFIGPAGEATSTGGRPPAQFAFNPSARVALAADVGATHGRVAVTDLAGHVLAEHRDDLDVGLGPDTVLRWMIERFHELLASVGRGPADLIGIGVGLPGPVEHSSGRPVNPPIMPGWDNFDVQGYLREHLGVVALVDNDVNIMALGEHFTQWPTAEHMMFVKVATGIGSGLMSHGRLHRGAQGAAGDLGHLQLPHGSDIVCRCGNTGCLEAVASGAAIAARLTDQGLPAKSSQDVVALARGGSVEALHAVRQAGRDIGEVLAAAVSLFNPSVIVIGGSLARAGEHLIAGVREVVYRRSLPLATQDLRIVQSRTGDRAGIIGAAVMVIDHALAPAHVDALIS